jgi:hypothetical protein
MTVNKQFLAIRFFKVLGFHQRNTPQKFKKLKVFRLFGRLQLTLLDHWLGVLFNSNDPRTLNL